MDEKSIILVCSGDRKEEVYKGWNGLKKVKDQNKYKKMIIFNLGDSSDELNNQCIQFKDKYDTFIFMVYRES